MKYILIIFLLLLLSIIVHNMFNIEYFYNPTITTWTPYIIDVANQPGYSNYFYNNGYMYPIY